MKYNVGDKVRIKPKFHFCSVDGFNNINMKDEFFNEYSRLPYCETIMTIGIVNKDFYILKEDRWAYKWTDEMIECKVEEETKPQFEDEDKPQMVSIDKVKEWIFDTFYEDEHDGDYDYGQPYIVCTLDTMGQLLDDFEKTMED